MRKTWIILTAVVIISCILIAGCITSDAPQTDEPVLTITFEKTGTSYNIGESFKVTLPSNPSTGYDWEAAEVKGLEITKEYVAAEPVMPGSPGNTVFTITSLEEGTFEYVFEYKRSWETDVAPLYIYKDKRTTVASSDEPMTEPRGFVVLEGNVNPTVGEIVKITTTGNPTTGYVWSALESEGLKVIKSEYIGEKTELLGAGGTYEWFVTADKAGSYLFLAEEKRSSETEPVSKYSVGITFADKK